MERIVEVTMTVRVKTDDTKFTPEFMEEFRGIMFPFDTVDEHAEHIAQLAAREVYELADFNAKEFVEGYGPIGEFGITADVLSCETTIIERQEGPVA